ncbi:hypothetical protein A4X13_0g7819 [Tilletia indica]|uniref:Uncharacterized protein n=1 Tax=Tilletia indica TaxID=43049 RepID=A0A8T8SI38_9BASI|nr:hypothetical protein A4X13_0g7819 [Tilletia indica]
MCAMPRGYHTSTSPPSKRHSSRNGHAGGGGNRESASALVCRCPGFTTKRRFGRCGINRALQREMVGPYGMAPTDDNIGPIGAWSVTTVTSAPSKRCARRENAQARQESSNSEAAIFCSETEPRTMKRAMQQLLQAGVIDRSDRAKIEISQRSRSETSARGKSIIG